MNKRDVARLNAAVRGAVRGFLPPERLTVSEWADKKRRLSPESSAEAGAWRTDRTPYLREIMDSFTDPRVRNIVLVSSSQVGKSETINNMIGYVIDQDPGSILFIQPTTVDAKEYSKLRIAPMIRDCRSLRTKVSDPKSRDSGNTILQKNYPGGILTLCGSSEAHALASKPIRYIFGDERDRWAGDAGKEGDPWELAKARQITFYNAKSVEVSTPTVKNASVIEKAYAKGTRERWKTQCPHCGEYREIVFDDIRYKAVEDIEDKGSIRLESLYYLCPACGGLSTEAEMKRQPSRWEAENPAALENTGVRSFWLSSWVSPWAGWESTILLYLQARGDTRQLQVVYNTRFGQLWEDRGGLEDESGFLSRREEYKAELPEGVLLLTMGVDVQDDRFEYEIVGHGSFGETWGIRKGYILGRADADETWEALDEILAKVYRFENGVGLPLSMTFVDEGGHFTQDVRLRCRDRQGRKVFAIKGQGGDGVPFTAPPKKQNIVVRGKVIGQCWVFTLGVDAGKHLIFDCLRVQTPGRRFCHFPKQEECGYDGKYFWGLLSERLVYKAGLKNPWKWEIIPGHERNEPLDCRNYALAAAKALTPDYDLLRQRLRDAAESGSVVKPPAPVKKKTGVVRRESGAGAEW